MENLFQTELNKAKLNLSGLNSLNQPKITPTAGTNFLGPTAPVMQGPTAPATTPQVKGTTATAPTAPVAGAMTPAQISAYYASQANSASPLSPAQWLAGQGAQPAPTLPQAPVPPPTEGVTKSDIPTTLTPDAFQADVSPYKKAQQDFMAQQIKLQQDFMQSQTPSAQEQALTEQMNALNSSARQAMFEAETRSGGTASFAGGESGRISRQATIQLQGVADQLNALVAQRGVQVDALKTQMQFNKENFDALSNLSKLTKPDVLSTKVSANGDVYSVVQNPDGTVSTVKSGNIPPDPADAGIEWKQFGSDKTGYSLWGVDAKGNIITKKLTGGEGGDIVAGTSPSGTPVKDLKVIKDAEITDLNTAIIAKDQVNRLVDEYVKNIEQYGTQVLFGEAAGKRSSLQTNLTFAMKDLAKAGALDKGLVDTLEKTIPSSKFFSTEAAQRAKLQTLKDTVNSKINDYIGSYKGTSAEVDPRTTRAFGGSSLAQDEQALLDKEFSGTTNVDGYFEI